MRHGETAVIGMLSALAAAGLAAAGVPAAAPAGPRVVISEIGCRPSQDRPWRWIELSNLGGARSAIGGWCVVDEDGHVFIIPRELEPVPPGGIVLLIFPASRSGEGAREGDASHDDLGFRGDNAATVFCRESWSGSAFQGRGNECAFYSSERRTAEHLADYVRWGEDRRALTAAHEAAVERGMWYRGVGIYVGISPRPGDEAGLGDGGSLARLEGRGWLICTPTDATPGARNRWPAPMPMSPYHNTIRYVEDPLSFSWRTRAAPGALPRIQVSRDADFADLVVDDLRQSHEIAIYDLEPGTYFWRMRNEVGEDHTNWSFVSKFTLRHDVDRGPPAWRVGPLGSGSEKRSGRTEQKPDSNPSRGGSAGLAVKNEGTAQRPTNAGAQPPAVEQPQETRVGTETEVASGAVGGEVMNPAMEAAARNAPRVQPEATGAGARPSSGGWVNLTIGLAVSLAIAGACIWVVLRRRRRG